MPTTDAPRTRTTPGDPEQDHYPHTGTHEWGEFAGLAIELGGYGDITAIDPYSGDRFWLADAFSRDASTSMPLADDWYNALRKLIDAMEAANWPSADR